MAVEKLGEKYRCNVCNNEVVVIKIGSVELFCCGQSMEKIEGQGKDKISIKGGSYA